MNDQHKFSIGGRGQRRGLLPKNGQIPSHQNKKKDIFHESGFEQFNQSYWGCFTNFTNNSFMCAQQ
jgi:hypothetical protein